MASHLGQPFVSEYFSKRSLVILRPLGTGSDADGPDGGSVLLGGFAWESCVITPVVSHGLVLIFTRDDFVAWVLSGLGVTARALTTIPLGRATKCSPEVK